MLIRDRKTHLIIIINIAHLHPKFQTSEGLFQQQYKQIYNGKLNTTSYCCSQLNRSTKFHASRKELNHSTKTLSFILAKRSLTIALSFMWPKRSLTMVLSFMWAKWSLTIALSFMWAKSTHILLKKTFKHLLCFPQTLFIRSHFIFSLWSTNKAAKSSVTSKSHTSTAHRKQQKYQSHLNHTSQQHTKSSKSINHTFDSYLSTAHQIYQHTLWPSWTTV